MHTFSGDRQWLYRYHTVTATLATKVRAQIGLGKPKTKEIVICCISAKHTTKRKNWLAQNQDESESGDISIRWLLFQWANIIQIKLSVLV